jgi:hypothetical protein
MRKARTANPLENNKGISRSKMNLFAFFIFKKKGQSSNMVERGRVPALAILALLVHATVALTHPTSPLFR